MWVCAPAVWVDRLITFVVVMKGESARILEGSKLDCRCKESFLVGLFDSPFPLDLTSDSIWSWMQGVSTEATEAVNKWGFEITGKFEFVDFKDKTREGMLDSLRRGGIATDFPLECSIK